MTFYFMQFLDAVTCFYKHLYIRHIVWFQVMVNLKCREISRHLFQGWELPRTCLVRIWVGWSFGGCCWYLSFFVRCLDCQSQLSDTRATSPAAWVHTRSISPPWPRAVSAGANVVQPPPHANVVQSCCGRCVCGPRSVTAASYVILPVRGSTPHATSQYRSRAEM